MANRENSLVVISRKEARGLGLTHYFTGRPCRRGHISRRIAGSGSCCECRRLLERARYAKNPKKHREKVRRQYKKNPEIYLQRRHDYQIKMRNDEEFRRKNAERARRWAEENPHRVKINARKSKRRRRAREYGAEGSFTAEDVTSIIKMQRKKCAYCRDKLGPKYHVDHIVAMSRGGSNDRRNLQVLCAPCNWLKNCRDPLDHARSLGLLL